MYSYCVWPWLCKQSSLRGQFIQTLKEHSFTLTARAIRPCTKPWFCVPYVYQRIQRRWMVFKRDKQKPIHLHYRMSARLSLSLNLSTWNWNHPARLQATSDKWENIFSYQRNSAGVSVRYPNQVQQRCSCCTYNHRGKKIVFKHHQNPQMITSVQRLPVFYTQLRKMERAESKTDCNPAPCLSREKPCLLFKQLH